jgi:hypothetical protein
MTKFEAYSTNLGLFVKLVGHGQHGLTERSKVNGIFGHTFQKIDVRTNSYTNSTWYFLEGVQKIESYEVLKGGANKHVGYTLKISSIANDEIPLNLSVEDVEPHVDDEGDTVWKNYSDYCALYKPVHEKLEDEWVSEEFEVVVLRSLNIDSYESPDKMQVEVMNSSGWSAKIDVSDLSGVVYYEDFERLLTPEFLLHTRPCRISSSQVYSIVRAHVKNNINPATARITSDYDFCFAVSRKIAIKPYVNKKEIKTQRGRSYSTPRYTTSTVQHKELPLFEMTTAEKPHGGYTPIKGWEANSLKEMQEQVGVYLTSLMDEINMAVSECSNCGGTGCVSINKINANERSN